MGPTACTEPQCLYKGDVYLFVLNIWTSVITNGWKFEWSESWHQCAPRVCAKWDV